MKTTLEIPDRIFRRAKSKATEKGKPLRQFVTDTVQVKLKEPPGIDQKPWMKHMGKQKHLRKETARISRLVEEAFEEVGPEMWATGTHD
jgi:hypothetical protein